MKRLEKDPTRGGLKLTNLQIKYATIKFAAYLRVTDPAKEV